MVALYKWYLFIYFVCFYLWVVWDISSGRQFLPIVSKVVFAIAVPSGCKR